MFLQQSLEWALRFHKNFNSTHLTAASENRLNERTEKSLEILDWRCFDENHHLPDTLWQRIVEDIRHTRLKLIHFCEFSKKISRLAGGDWKYCKQIIILSARQKRVQKWATERKNCRSKAIPKYFHIKTINSLKMTLSSLLNSVLKFINYWWDWYRLSSASSGVVENLIFL